MSLCPADAEDRRFWTALAPSLSIEGDGLSPRLHLPSPDALLPDLRREGYVNVAGAFDEAAIAPARHAVATVAAHGIPLPFAFVYDEVWALFVALRPFLAAALGDGYRMLPDFWAWQIAPDDDAHGWGPHRDRIRPTVDAENNPASLTVWLPLTDATPLNGCIYVLPAHRDDCFRRRVWDGPDNTLVAAPQDIRALPAAAGSLLAWNQALLHWGGRASRLAVRPRVSLSCEFQRGDRGAINPPRLDPHAPPPFLARLGLAGKQVLQYRHMYPLDAAAAALAEDLRERHMPYESVMEP